MTTDLIVVVAVGVGTYLSRFAFIALFGKVDPPPWLAALLPYVPPAVLAALVASIVASANDGNEALAARIAAVLVAGLVAVRTRSVFWTLAVGLPSLWLASALVGLTVS